MAKIINLTESDIRRIVERVINEDLKYAKNKIIVRGIKGSTVTYTGNYYLKNNRVIPHGYGKMFDIFGDYEVGKWEHGKLNGFGKEKHGREEYEGNFKNGEFDGFGILKNVESDNDYYKGNWKNGSPHGYGVFINNKNTWKGNWINGQLKVGFHEYYMSALRDMSPINIDKPESKKPKTPKSTTNPKTPKVTTKPKKKCNFVSMPFKEENFCKLPTDTKWVYIKTDEGKWYTSKQTDKKTWCELTPEKFQKAIDILEPACVKSQVVAQSQIDSGTETLV